MPFNSKNINSDGLVNNKFQNIRYCEDQTVTFSAKKIYSHFGISKTAKYNKHSVSVSVTDTKLLNRLLAVEKRCLKLLGEPNYPLGHRLFKRINQKDGQTYFNLNVEPELVSIGKEKACLFSGLITITAIYHGDKGKKQTPNLIIALDDVVFERTERRSIPTPKRVALDTDSDDDEQPKRVALCDDSYKED